MNAGTRQKSVIGIRIQSITQSTAPAQQVAHMTTTPNAHYLLHE